MLEGGCFVVVDVLVVGGEEGGKGGPFDGRGGLRNLKCGGLACFGGGLEREEWVGWSVRELGRGRSRLRWLRWRLR